MDQKVFPHILCRDDGEKTQFAVASVDGIPALVVVISEELAHSLIGVMGEDGMQAQPVSVEEIEEACAGLGVATVGIYGLDDGMGMDVLPVEGLPLVFEET